jgi:NADH pyrophosphatase NudC (nudix superfamily)
VSELKLFTEELAEINEAQWAKMSEVLREVPYRAGAILTTQPHRNWWIDRMNDREEETLP